MRTATLILLVVFGVMWTSGQIEDCSISLDVIQNAVQQANLARALCERNFFAGSYCDSYWTLMNTIVNYQFSYQACNEQINNDLVEYLEGDDGESGVVYDQGEMTRDALSNATLTLTNLINMQTSALQATVTFEANTTIQQLTQLVNTDGTNTRTEIDAQTANTMKNLTLEALNTRAEVDAQHAITRDNLTAEAIMTRNTVETQSTMTRATVTLEATLTMINTSLEAIATRTEVDTQQALTRQRVSTEATNTRTEVDYQHSLTRADVDSQNLLTRNTLVAEVDSQSLATRVNTSLEAQTTRTAVQQDGDATRATVTAQATNTRQSVNASVIADGTTTRTFIQTQEDSTRATVVAQANNTNNQLAAATTAILNTVNAQATATQTALANQHFISNTNITNEANNTRNVINQGIATVTNNQAAFQSSQNAFQALFIKIFIEATFANVEVIGGQFVYPGNVDIFMRPAADGGYYETASSIVNEIYNYNLLKYPGNTVILHNAYVYLGNANNAVLNKNYRTAYNLLQAAYWELTSA